MTFELQEIRPQIFLMSFKNRYDLAMYFLRYQEFYESPSPTYRGQAFEILDFMRWYSLEYGNGVFTYPDDWAGFNISGNIIKQVWDLGITDRNKYDYEMWQIYQKCQEQTKGDFYLIGTASDEKENVITLEHEVAHGFFYTLPIYKEEMIKLVQALSVELYDSLIAQLENSGYTSEVYVDEIQAYMATGLPMYADDSALYKKLEKAQIPFTKLFKQYYQK